MVNGFYRNGKWKTEIEANKENFLKGKRIEWLKKKKGVNMLIRYDWKDEKEKKKWIKGKYER